MYKARRTTDLLTDKQHGWLEDLFVAETYVEVEATWGVYQEMIAVYDTMIAAAVSG